MNPLVSLLGITLLTFAAGIAFGTFIRGDLPPVQPQKRCAMAVSLISLLALLAALALEDNAAASLPLMNAPIVEGSDDGDAALWLTIPPRQSLGVAALAAASARALEAARLRLGSGSRGGAGASGEAASVVDDVVAALRGAPSDGVLEWLVGLRERAAAASAAARHGVARPCALASFTVGFYAPGAVVPKEKRLPHYVPDEAVGVEAGCGVAFVNAEFLRAGGVEHIKDAGGGSGAIAQGWVLVVVETEEGGEGGGGGGGGGREPTFPFRSGSASNDAQRAAHMLKAAAPLLFPSAAIALYGDTKCAEGNHLFPAARLARLLRERFPRAPLAALQHPGLFGQPLSIEFLGTIKHMLARREQQSVFDDIVALQALLGGVLDIKVPMIDAICLAFRSGGALGGGAIGATAGGGAAGGTAGGVAASGEADLRGGGVEMYSAVMRLSLTWTAIIERFSMREQLSFNVAASLALSPEWGDAEAGAKTGELGGAGEGRGSSGFMGFAPCALGSPVEVDGIAYIHPTEILGK